MPKLKHLLCSIEHADSNVPFREYGTSYGDGFVQTHIVAPPVPVPFTLHLSSTSYIAPGLAMFVFMDGVYQCNRNVDGLVPLSEATEGSQTEIEFRVRQKEQMLNEDTWIGREWRFEKFNISTRCILTIRIDRSSLILTHAVSYTVTGETYTQPHTPKAHLSSLGLIEVVVLRCLNSIDPMTAPPPHIPPTAPSNRGRSRTPKSEPSPPSLNGLFFDGAGDSYLRKCASFGLDGVEDQSTKSETKTVRFGEDESWGWPQERDNMQWEYSYTGPKTGTWHAMDGSYDRNYRRGEFRPEETWERRTQAYEHYREDWQNPDDQYGEPRSQGTRRDGRNYNYYGRQNAFNYNRTRPLTANDQRPRIRPEGNGRIQPPDLSSTSRGPPTYRPSGSFPGRQRYGRRYWHRTGEDEAGERNNDRYDIQDQHDRSGYVDNWGDWVDDGFGIHEFGRAGCPFPEPQPPGLSGPPQEQPTHLGHWKASSEHPGRNNTGDLRATQQGTGDDTGKHCNHREDIANTRKGDTGLDIPNWIAHGDSGTWKPPSGNGTNIHRTNQRNYDALGPQVSKANIDISHIGQGVWGELNANRQSWAGRGVRTSDTNRSNRRGGNDARSNRENKGSDGDRETSNQKNNWVKIRGTECNANTSRRGGSKSNECGCNQRDRNGGQDIDHYRDQGSRNESRINRDKKTASIRESRANECGCHDKNWSGARENDDCRNRGNWNEVGGANDNPSNNGKVGWGRGGEHTNYPNTYQANINRGEGGNSGRSNKGDSVGGRDSAQGNRPGVDQGHLKHNRVSSNSPNYGALRRNGGNGSHSNCGRSGGCGGGGRSNYGGSAWGENRENPLRLDTGANDQRAGNHVRSNRGENVTIHEANDGQGGEDGGCGFGDTERGKIAPCGENGDGTWNNTGEAWGGGNGNGGDFVSDPNDNGNTNNWGGCNNEPRAWEGGGDNGECDGGSNQNPNPDATNCDWDGADNPNGNSDNVDLNTFTNEANGSGNDTYKADENNNRNEETPNSADNQQVNVEEAVAPNSPSAEPNLPYAKPYWSSWTAESGLVESPTEPNTSRKRGDSFHSGEELPLYLIHENQLGNCSARHQVRHGRPEFYARKLRKPIYLDTMAEPYAVFAFKYRPKETIEQSLKVSVDDEEEDEKARLMRLSKDEVIEELLQMKLKASASSNPAGYNNTASEKNEDSTPIGNDTEPDGGGW